MLSLAALLGVMAFFWEIQVCFSGVLSYHIKKPHIPHSRKKSKSQSRIIIAASDLIQANLSLFSYKSIILKKIFKISCP